MGAPSWRWNWILCCVFGTRDISFSYGGSQISWYNISNAELLWGGFWCHRRLDASYFKGRQRILGKTIIWVHRNIDCITTQQQTSWAGPTWWSGLSIAAQSLWSPTCRALMEKSSRKGVVLIWFRENERMGMSLSAQRKAAIVVELCRRFRNGLQSTVFEINGEEAR